MQKATQIAIQFLDVSEEDYMNSFKRLLQNSKDSQAEIEKMEMEIREANEPETVFSKSKDEVKKVYMEKLQMEAQGDVQLQQQAQGKPPQMV